MCNNVAEDPCLMPDEKLVLDAKHGDTKALDYIIEKYRNYVCSKAKTYFLIGADKEDIIQEGMIGLYKAVRDFKDDKLSSFRAFAELCITRQMITAIKTATRQKHIPLNSYVSLNKPTFDEDTDRTLMDVIPYKEISNPEDMFINQEQFSVLKQKISSILSSFELKVLSLYIQGKSYQEISVKLDKQVKSIDNALQRVKKKFDKNLREIMYL